MGGWVVLKAIQSIPQVKKAFALSIWNIYDDFKTATNEKELMDLAHDPEKGGTYYVLNASITDIFDPVLQNKDYFNLALDGDALAGKQIIMLDEHHRNQEIASAIKRTNKTYFNYEVWDTDHAFTNKRISMINMVLSFLNQ
jgi:hypothetical protein